MKTFLIVSCAIIALFVIGKGQCQKARNEVVSRPDGIGVKIPFLPKEKETPPSIPPTKKVVEVEPVKGPDIEGWTFVEKKTGYNWYLPNKVVPATPWFGVRTVKITDELDPPVIMDFRKKDSSKQISSVLINREGRFLELTETVFHSLPMSDKEFKSLGNDSEAIRYRPYGKYPIESLRVGLAVK